MIVHIAMYQCVYMPKLKSSATASGADQTDVVNGGGNAIVYDVVHERRRTAALEMKENEAYIWSC